MTYAMNLQNDTATAGKIYNFPTISRVGQTTSASSPTSSSFAATLDDVQTPAIKKAAYTQPTTSNQPVALTAPSTQLETTRVSTTRAAITADTAASTTATADDEPAMTADDVKISLGPNIDPSASHVSTEDNDASFSDLIDIINPLQHIPVIGTIYRSLTGDTIKPAERLIGDVLVGAATGALVLSGVASIISLAIEQQTGKEPTTLVADALFGTDTESTVQLAENNAPSTTDTSATLTQQKTNVAADTTSTAPTPLTAAPQPVQLAAASTTQLPTGNARGTLPKTIRPSHGSQAALALATAKNPMTMIGNKIYTNNNLANALPAAKAPSNATTETAAAKPSKQTAASVTAGLNLPLPGSTEGNNKNLGQLMQQTADVKSSGGTLPPNLVHDMMLMALDKYKTASGGALSEMKTKDLNVN